MAHVEGDASWITEAVNPDTAQLDRLSTPDLVAALLAEEARVARAVSAVSAEIAQAVDMVAEALSGGGRLCYAGAGTSGRLGVADAAECPPTFGTDPEMVIALVAGGPEAVFRAREGAEDDEEAGAEAVAGADLGSGDVLVGLSASGRTPFVLGALRAARGRGCATVLVTVAAAAGREVADLCIVPETGPEALAGSTRLKAATATKMVLSTLTTGAMVRLGKVHGNLMVDLSPTCSKLEERARRILQACAGVDAETADRLMQASGNRTRLAILLAHTGEEAEQARSRLEAAGGSLRDAIDAIDGIGGAGR